MKKFDNPIIGGEKGASNKNSGKLSAINREYKSLIRQELRALGGILNEKRGSLHTKTSPQNHEKEY
ncbi:MAG: hypothetical protein PUJ75_08105 [Bacteroidales bacterium]|nr:hypothetical protein [Bacteroidales bacterium]MDY5789047.1 hypothetical protein [Candidatus Onthomorpha sp.]MDY5921888.1 hypothetical protein [Candidatus Onthomorpha sp.]